MLHIVGNSARKVEIRDLGDVVYYRQHKVFSDTDYKTSKDLRDAIESGKLLVTENRSDSRPTNNCESFSTGDSSGAAQRGSQDKANGVDISDFDSRIDSILDRMDKLEGLIANNSNNQTDVRSYLDTIADSVKEIVSAKINEELPKTSRIQPDIEGKLDSLINLLETSASRQAAPPMAANYTEGRARADRRPSTVNEVFIPSIQVEDGNANISLTTRVVDGGESQVSDALSALKSMRNLNKEI